MYRSEMTAAFEFVAQAQAKEYLASLAPHQRLLNESKARLIAWQMSNGKWYDHGASVQFDWDGHLCDGRHRLEGVARSGKTQRFLVVRGVDPKAFSYIDIGLRRTTSQFVDSPHRVDITQAAELRQAFQVTRGSMKSLLNVRADLSIEDTISYIEAHPEIAELAPTARIVHAAIRLNPGTHLALLSGVVHTMPGEMREWCRGLTEGTGLLAGDARLVLRERWLRESNALNLGNQAAVLTRWAYVVKAWNAFVTGRSISILRYRPGEPMPLPVGM